MSVLVATSIAGCAGSQPASPKPNAATAAPPTTEAPAQPARNATTAPASIPSDPSKPEAARGPKTAAPAPIVITSRPATEPMPLPPWWFDGPRFEGEHKERVRIVTIGEAPTLSAARRHALDAGRASVKSLLGREPRQVVTERVWTTTSEHGFRVYVLTMGE